MNKRLTTSPVIELKGMIYMDYIVFDNVCKYYKMGSNVITAADHITFSVKKGEFCVVVGPSGAGKTTLLNILGGMRCV